MFQRTDSTQMTFSDHRAITLQSFHRYNNPDKSHADKQLLRKKTRSQNGDQENMQVKEH